ncbi:uncharacterized protein LOC135847692 [Planococcus citri]|uniref:uncharacterized protein LOC135847692 n=1 Tax=Planococcus citri TaxID=170843 RepID=UPI0031F7508E
MFFSIPSNMNPRRSFIFHCFVIVVIASSTIHCVLGLLYEPIYYLNKPGDRNFAFQEVEYNDSGKHYVLKTGDKNKPIYTACPRQGWPHPSVLETQNIVAKEVSVTQQCDILPKPQVFISINPKVYSAVGFLIRHVDWSHYASYYVPENHAVIGLIYFKFDPIYNRIVFLKYTIVGGNFLTPDIARNMEKNINVFGYDIDPLYEPGCPFVKVPLAPVADFLFDSWKLAPQQNILTAAMLRVLQPQWQALEIFIRKISQVVELITVTTGIFGHLLNSPYENENSSFEYVYLDNSELRPPQYFWKTVTLEFTHDNKEYKSGILFIMHNVRFPDPNTKSGVKKFCSPSDIASMGWEFLEDDQFRGPMYSCPLEKEIMKFFGEEIHGEFEPFNLNSLTVLMLNDDNDDDDDDDDDDDNNFIVMSINVVEEMKKFEKGLKYEEGDV